MAEKTIINDVLKVLPTWLSANPHKQCKVDDVKAFFWSTLAKDQDFIHRSLTRPVLGTTQAIVDRFLNRKKPSSSSSRPVTKPRADSSTRKTSSSHELGKRGKNPPESPSPSPNPDLQSGGKEDEWMNFSLRSSDWSVLPTDAKSLLEKSDREGVALSTVGYFDARVTPLYRVQKAALLLPGTIAELVNQSISERARGFIRAGAEMDIVLLSGAGRFCTRSAVLVPLGAPVQKMGPTPIKLQAQTSDLIPHGIVVAASLATPEAKHKLKSQSTTAEMIASVLALIDDHLTAHHVLDLKLTDMGARATVKLSRAAADKLAKSHLHLNAQALFVQPPDDQDAIVWADMKSEESKSLDEALKIAQTVNSHGLAVMRGEGKNARIGFRGVPAALPAIRKKILPKTLWPPECAMGVIGKATWHIDYVPQDATAEEVQEIIGAISQHMPCFLKAHRGSLLIIQSDMKTLPKELEGGISHGALLLIIQEPPPAVVKSSTPPSKTVQNTHIPNSVASSSDMRDFRVLLERVTNMVVSFDRRLDLFAARQKELSALIIAAFRSPEASRLQFVDAMTATAVCSNLVTESTDVGDLTLDEVALRQYLRNQVGPALQHALEEEQKRVDEFNERMAEMDEENATFSPAAGPADDDADVTAFDTKSAGRRSRSPSLAGIQSATKKR